MAVRSHVEFAAPLTTALVAAASHEAGRGMSRDETAAVLTREWQAVVDRWTALGAWVERVESGAWLRDYQQRRERAAYARPLGHRSSLRSTASRARMAEAKRASWARRREASGAVASMAVN